MRIAAIGDNCVDIYPDPGWVFPGGGGVNFAVHAKRYGADSAYLGAIGKDDYGRLIKESLELEGVDTKQLVELDGPTAWACVRLEGSERTFIGSDRGVRELFSINAETKKYISKFDHIHTTLDGCVDEQISNWSEKGIKISYDFSHRAKPEQYQLLPHIDIAFISGQHISKEDAHSQLRKHHADGCPLVVMTFSEQGSLAYNGHLYEQEALPVKAVDTLGAGDAFQAVFVVTYQATNDIELALLRASQEAAQACRDYGSFGHKLVNHKNPCGDSHT
jgi:fructoselysine 6-kinase